MVHTLRSPQGSRFLYSVLWAAAVVLGLTGSSQAKDAKSDARYQIARLKADIAKASQEVSSRQGRILAGDLLIVANEVAIEEARKKENNEVTVIALQVTLAALKAKKNDLIKEKQDWERVKQDSERSLAQWEDYLRKLGG